MANMAQAIRMALHYGEENLGITNIFGEDVGPPLGGVFTVTQGLKTTWNSPLDERGIIGAAIGLGLAGKRCVAEIQFCDYIYNTHRSSQTRRHADVGVQWRLVLRHDRHDSGRKRHPRLDLSLAFFRCGDDPHPGLEDRHAFESARRIRPDARLPQGSEPDDVPQAQGASARSWQRAHPGRTTPTKSSFAK